MALVHRVRKRERNVSTDADQCRLLNAEFRRDLVGSAGSRCRGYRGLGGTGSPRRLRFDRKPLHLGLDQG
jgi:hypothetical protein